MKRILNSCKPFDESDGEEKTKLLTRVVERITSAETAKWKNLQDESHKPFRAENQAAVKNSADNAENANNENNQSTSSGASSSTGAVKKS